MIYIKRFIDKVTYMESRSSKDLVMSLDESRGLRDELAKMLADNCSLLNTRLSTPVAEPIIQVEIVGGKF